MVEHPSEYPWSSYRANALGEVDSLITKHYKYRELGHSHETQQSAYRTLFKAHISEKTLAEIRDTTNKEWVLGSDSFKEKISRQLMRRAKPLTRGGDRKSERYRKQHAIN
jgi:putative transposase